MNRGINGEEIFYGDNNKAQFLDYLEEYSTKLKIRILAYCLLDNHYHLIIENKIGMSTEEINTATLIGKRLRGELLVWLKDYAGLKYTEIAEFPLFNDIRANSLPQLYKNARRRK